MQASDETQEDKIRELKYSGWTAMNGDENDLHKQHVLEKSANYKRILKRR